MRSPKVCVKCLKHERGIALLVVTVILVIVLVGGLAAVAITSGQLDSSRGFRARQSSQSCAEAGLEKIRAVMPDLAAANLVTGSLNAGGALTYAAGHYAGASGGTAVETLSPAAFDGAALFSGENITNSLGAGAVGSGSSVGVGLYSATSVCSGTGSPPREMEIVFRYGNVLGSR
jgi:hypothetical protein